MLQILLVSLLLFCAMAYGEDRMRVTRSDEITINGPIDKVFPLFTPAGEKLWIPHWRYVPIYPAGGETERDMVFRTDEQTLWTLAAYDPPHRSIYVHTSPEELARIEVECSVIDSNRTRIRITYVITAITEHAQQVAAVHQSEEEFRKKMEQWKQWLDAYAMKEGWTK